MRISARPLQLLLLCLLCGGAAACVPAISPPVRLAGGGGFLQANPGNSQAVQGAGRIHVGVHPLRFLPSMHDRIFDGSFGYAVNLTPDRLPHHAVYFEGFVFPWISESESQPQSIEATINDVRSLCRVEVGAFAKAVNSGSGQGWGYGGGLEFRFSWSDFALGEPTADDRFVGVAWGEGGIGAGLLVEYYTVDAEDFLMFSFELNFDLPAFVGLIMMPELLYAL